VRLATSDKEVPTILGCAIAHEVGYHNPFVFSNAFTKWIGWRPSEYRRKKWNSAPNNRAHSSRNDVAQPEGSRIASSGRGLKRKQFASG